MNNILIHNFPRETKVRTQISFECSDPYSIYIKVIPSAKKPYTFKFSELGNDNTTVIYNPKVKETTEGKRFICKFEYGNIERGRTEIQILTEDNDVTDLCGYQSKQIFLPSMDKKEIKIIHYQKYNEVKIDKRISGIYNHKYMSTHFNQF